MKFHEYGNPNGQPILILHGMMQKWQTLQEIFTVLEDEYRLIYPALTGYTEGDENYVSFQDECAQMESYVKENCGGELLAVYGISQGAMILSELTARNSIKIKYVFLDGVYTAHQGKLCGKLGAFAIRKIKKNGLGGNPLKGFGWAVKLMGMTTEDITAELNRFNLNFPDEHLDRYFIENYTYRANPDLVNTDSRVYLWCGSKEPYAIKSHKDLKQYIKNYEEEIFPDMGHSNMIIKHSDVLIGKIRDIIK